MNLSRGIASEELKTRENRSLSLSASGREELRDDPNNGCGGKLLPFTGLV